MWQEKTTSLDNFKIELLKILQRDSLLIYREDEHHEYLKSKFGQFHEASISIINEIDHLVRKEPEFIRGIATNFFTNNMQTFVALYDISRNEKAEPDGYFDKMKVLSKMYEVLHIYKFAAFLFSRRNDPYSGFSNDNKEKILKYLNSVGVTKQDASNLRLIRNSINHLPKLENDEIIFKSGDKMNVNDINLLYIKMKELFSWWASLLGTLCFYMPKFGIIVLFAGIKSIQNNKDSDMFSNTMSTFFPEYREEQDKRKNKKLIRKQERQKLGYRIKSFFRSVKWKLLTKYYGLLGKNKFIFEKFYQDNFDEIANHLIKHSKEISNELRRLELASSDNDAKNQYKVTADWFAKGKPMIEQLLYNYRIEGPSFFIKKIRKAKKE